MKFNIISRIKQDYSISSTNWPYHIGCKSPFLFLKNTKKHYMYIHHFHDAVSFFSIIEKIN